MTDKKTPIEQVTALLAEMTARATEAEQRANAAEKSTTEWYTRYCVNNDKIKEANARIAELEKQLSEKTQRLESTEDDLQRAVEYIEQLTVPTKKSKEKGAKNNG